MKFDNRKPVEVISTRTMAKISKKDLLFGLVNLLLVVGIVLTLLLITRDLILWLTPKKVGANLNTTKHQAQTLDAKNLDLILTKNLFGTKSGEFKPLTSHEPSLQQPTEYKLVGTLAGSPNWGFAVFSDSQGRQEFIRVGSPVGNLGVLKRVEPQKVLVMMKNGQTIELNLVEIVRIEDAQPQSQLQQVAPKRLTDIAKQTGERSFVVDQKKIQYAIENPSQIMTDARLLPNFVDGIQKGFVLREVKPGGIYHSLGLRDGDVLLRINEYNINNPESGLQAFMALRGLERVHLDIIRGGTNMTLTYLIR